MYEATLFVNNNNKRTLLTYRNVYEFTMYFDVYYCQDKETSNKETGNKHIFIS